MARGTLLVRVVAPRDDVTGLDEDLLDVLRDEAQENIQIGMSLLADEIRRTLSHRGAAPAPPGEPPRLVEGGLLKSWKTGRFGWANVAKTLMRGAVESWHLSAGRLEFGDLPAGISPHPYARPTEARIRRDLEGVLAEGDAYWGKR